MATITRRETLLAAAGVAALGLSGRVVFAQDASAGGKGHFAYKVGDIDVIGLHDGYWQMPLSPGFVGNAELKDVQDALEAGGHARDIVPISFAQTLIRTGGRTILVDAGTGGQLAPTAGNMIDHLKAAGIEPSEIDTILVSHYHPDHIFGLMAKDGTDSVFPDAEILVPATEHAFWTDPATMSAMPENRRGLVERINGTLGSWSNVTPFEVDKEVVPGILPLAAYGHTPGHTVFAVSSGNDQLLVAGDIANVPALFVANPGWHAAFDMDKDMAETTRRALFDRVIADDMQIAGYHFGFPNAGTLEKDGSGYAFEPMSS